MYKYKLNINERSKSRAAFQEERIAAFSDIEKRLNNIYPILDRAKDETIAHYQENPNSYSVFYPTDLILDYIKDIEELLKDR